MSSAGPSHLQPPASQLAWQPQARATATTGAARLQQQQTRDLQTAWPPPTHPDLRAVTLAMARSAVPIEMATPHADEPRHSLHYRWQARGRAYHLTLRRDEVLLTIDDHPLVGVFPTNDTRALAALRRHLPAPAADPPTSS